MAAPDKTLPSDDRVLAELVRRLAEAFQPVRIFLSGSKARGDTGPDSDYDLLIVVPDEASPERKRSRLAYQALRGTRTAADVLVWTRGAFDSRLHLPASLPATVVREGRLLYARCSAAGGGNQGLASQSGPGSARRRA